MHRTVVAEIVRTLFVATISALSVGLFMYNVGRSTQSAVVLGIWLFVFILLIVRLEFTKVYLLQPVKSRLGALSTVCLGGVLLGVTVAMATLLK